MNGKSKYTIGFKSGAQLQFVVNDGAQLVADIIAGISKDVNASVHIYHERGVMLLASDIEFICPSHMVKDAK